MDKRPSLARLTRVELRKMVDTRSGFWLQLAVVGLTILAVVITVLAGHEDDKNFLQILSNALVPAGTLLPVVGILLVSSEWSQRTALVSFSLVPNRSRLIGAKVLAGIVLALIAVVLAVVFAAIATAVGGSSEPHIWSLPAGLLFQDIVYVVTAMVIGIGFGAALQSSAPAIVLYFALPIALGALGSIHAIESVMEWLNIAQSTESFTTEIFSGHQWGQILVTLVLWMVLPLAFGLWRITKRDLN
jgi:ABC-type transport system involved in multi-copper enzyme maturation permease subunit